MFQLNTTLARDSHPIVEDADLLIRLIDDARFAWVLVVPKVAGLTELHDLDNALFDKTFRVVRRLGRVLKAEFAAEKINTAAIGNMVSQLHVHVVARHKKDAAWPGPVWGAGAMVSLSDPEKTKRIQLIKDGLRLD
tara:strand:- start:75167 stop:75574 length:408 start_codon:yes stop_codon:yes gene_type:complete